MTANELILGLYDICAFHLHIKAYATFESRDYKVKKKTQKKKETLADGCFFPMMTKHLFL